MDHKPRVLVFSTGDSTRSQMAEGFLRTFAGDEIIPVSTAVVVKVSISRICTDLFLKPAAMLLPSVEKEKFP